MGQVKENDLIKLINLKDKYIESNLYANVKGIILETNDKTSKVIFLNEYNMGDYAVIKVDNIDIVSLNEKMPKSLLDLISEDLSKINENKRSFQAKQFDIYAQVELIVEKDKYTKHGIYKGDIGYIVEENAINNYVIVDFGRLDEKNNFVGDCICVNIEDLKIVK